MGQVVYESEYVSIYVDDEEQYLETRFYDGTTVPAKPNYDKESIARAYELGYNGNTWLMSREHEITHTLLSGGISPTLWRVAHPNSDDVASDEMVYAEEAAVLAYQKLMNLRRIENR